MESQGAYNFLNINLLSIIRALDKMPFWEMLFIIIGSLLLVTTILIIVTHLFSKEPELSESAFLANDINAAVYGLILAFLVISMYETNQKVEESILKETNALVAILNGSEKLDNANQIRTAVQQYTKGVIEKEWPLMRLGDATKAWEIAPQIVAPLYTAIQASHPTGDVQKSFYDRLPGLLENVDSAHRARLAQTEFHLPIQFWRIIILMTVLSVWFIVYMNPLKGLGSTIPIIVPALVIGLCLSLLVSLHYPFLGPFSVSNKLYSSGQLDFEHSFPQTF